MFVYYTVPAALLSMALAIKFRNTTLAIIGAVLTVPLGGLIASYPYWPFALMGGGLLAAAISTPVFIHRKMHRLANIAFIVQPILTAGIWLVVELGR